ncbi:stabilin-2 isoform X2 [Bombina bombina]|uniref:stabilin-2 isoform X2 n=1 Tax=Bombina bombina TaxID=8345 RepID=UPI00235AA800|nr:stabilin-2 isoform X2 [Bombina bombina]
MEITFISFLTISFYFIGICHGKSSNEAKNRCDQKAIVMSKTPCQSCALNSNVNCSDGFTKTSEGSGLRDCRYSLDINKISLSLPGCRHTCVKESIQPLCCPGYWGPDCMECPGGAATPCTNRGTCSDGIQGNGNCTCQGGFGGTACETCAGDNLYGVDCSSECDCVHGVCNSGITGDGQCECFSGYGGSKCDEPLPDCAALQCPENSRCATSTNGGLECKCMPNYEGHGKNCKPINPCSKNICYASADCTYLGPNQHKCTCKEGYKGDGIVCLPVNPCQENFGNCPTNSSVCKYDGPGKSHCECKEGYKNFQFWIGCQLLDVCATKNPCSKNAICTTVAPGISECTCKNGYIGDGIVCYGNILERIKEFNTNPGQWQGKLSIAISLFEMYAWPLSSLGPFTVLVPINRGIKGKDVKNLLANKENALYFIKLHIIAGQLNIDDFNSTDVIYTLTGKAGEITNGDPDNQFKIRIHGSKKKGKLLQTNIIASNGIIHIIDRAMDFVEPTLESNTKETIMAILQDNGRYNRFRSLLEKSNLGPALENDGPYTIFVPNNGALDEMKDGELEYLLSKEGSRKLIELMRYHIVTSAELDVANIISSHQIMSMANQLIQFNTTNNGQILVNGEEVEEADVAAKNGRIYTLDGVLIPPSILPILPSRCDETKYELKLGSCVSCATVYLSKCLGQSTPTDIFSQRCMHMYSVMGFDYPRIGCSRYCNVTVKVPNCCKGFYGPECHQCPGGYAKPCSRNGQCMDGITGNGTCVCDKDFTGSICHFCLNGNKYGPRCDQKCQCVHGTCNNQIDSDGSCLPGSCRGGYAGKLCDKKTTPCGPLMSYCHAHADCEYSNGTPSCICKAGYEGDGIYCTEVNSCITASAVCHVNAECIPSGSGSYKCVCQPGWAGDGMDCSEINNCLTPDNGGCHVNATCVYIGPGQSDCECNKGFRGNGIECEPINECLEQKDKCHFLATCQKTPSGFWECVCQDGYEGDGTICYGNTAQVIASLTEASEFHKWINDATLKSMFSQSSNVTVLVPSRKAFENMSEKDKTYWLTKENMPTLLKNHILTGIYKVDDIKKLNSSHLLATTLHSNFLHLSKENENVTVEGANFVVGDILATNGVVHLIDKQYKLATEIEATDTYTIFAPHNDAINNYIRSKSPATVDEDTIRYHIVLGQQLLKNDLHNGMHRETMLGFSFQIGFFVHSGQTYINDAPVNYTNIATNKGIIHGIDKVLEIQKNRCDSNETTYTLNRCAECTFENTCPAGSKANLLFKKHCLYTKYNLQRKFIAVGCQTQCVTTIITRKCCAGFFGQQCLPCPGKYGLPCFGNGICMDGINGTGVCQCEDGYNGTACEMCVKGKYGSHCNQECVCVNGKCNEGINGDGSCECNVGWKGVKCDIVIKDDACNKTCHTSANCLLNADGSGYCKCAAGFKGNGTSCSAIDACATSNGGCSGNAECRKTTPGSRLCICKEGYTGDGIVCLEIDPCMENNGGCDTFAECTKIGPNQATCNCLVGYSGDGKKCTSINPCFTKNGGCSDSAVCNHTGPAERSCTCKSGFIGDGILCRGTISQELAKNPETSQFYNQLQTNNVNDLRGTGPFTVFVPNDAAYKNEPMIKEWTAKGMMAQVILYHVVSCAQLVNDDLKTMSKVTTLQGTDLTISVSQDSVVLNTNVNLITTDVMMTNGIVHIIDKFLVPKNMQAISKDVKGKVMDNFTKVTETYGYSTISKLIQDTGLLELINDPVHRPVTLFLPTDNAIKSLPKEQNDFLLNSENKDKLIQYLKYHIIRDSKFSVTDLVTMASIKTLQGLDLSIQCGNQDSIGNIYLDNRQCKLVQRNLEFDGGVIYGIDCLLTPQSIGGRCDNLVTFDVMGNCGMCFSTPSCPAGSKPKGEKKKCRYSLTQKRVLDGCRYECAMVIWMTKCCAGYFGKDCQACPGGPETPCNNHGACDDGYEGTGRCKCSPEFNGTACELCLPGRYGSDCKLCDCTDHGECDDGISGTGQCTCESGWTGKRCETKLVLPPVCTPVCSSNAVCREKNTCECKNLYEGDGRTCKAVNLCKQNNGKCDVNAKCSQSGVKVTCSCLKGYKGDGYICAAIDPCVDGLNGGCHEHAICTMTGPDKRKCECKDKYIGDGIDCEVKKLPIDRCLQDNGQCHADANCDDLHFQDTKVGVFHLRSSKGQYKYTYNEAVKACTDEEATISTYNQMLYAQQAGYHLCSAGWLDNSRVGYPTAYSNPNCGSGFVGIVDYGVRVNLSETWDVFCYRVKDVKCTCKAGYIGDGYACNGNLLQVLESFPMFSNFLSAILVYSNTSAKGQEFVNYLTNLSIQATLFAPSNDGLYENKTLSGRDIEYHLANISNYFFEDLTNGTVLQTRIGNKLTIFFDNGLDDKMSSAGKSQNQTRYVEGKRILQWDLFASNGVIHIISEPLTAPPEPIALHAGHGAGIFFGIVFVAGLVALGIYCYKKFRRQDFRFQKFNEFDEKRIVSQLDKPPASNISNPMYENSAASAAPSEPVTQPAYDLFSDSDEQQLVDFGGHSK